jgi:hypothetical protein
MAITLSWRPDGGRSDRLGRRVFRQPDHRAETDSRFPLRFGEVDFNSARYVA